MTDGAPSVDARGINLPGTCEGALDVLFDGRRIFSAAAEHVPGDTTGHWQVPWPPSLREFLRGHTHVLVRERSTGRTLLSEEVALDDSDDRVAITDSEGHPLAVDKWSGLVRTFESASEEVRRELTDDLGLLLSTINEYGLDAFVAYGTLLGAVRSETFIAHDNDVDIAYVSRFENPVDVALESFKLQRFLVERGWHISRSRAGFCKIRVSEHADAQRNVDVFSGYFCGDYFAIERWVRAHLTRSDILPLGEVMLDGARLPAPARPEKLLAATYGEGWRVPDPTFSFRTPSSTSRRAEAWFGRFYPHRRPWLQYYASEGEVVPTASAFAQWVGRALDDGEPVIDVGCGTGADMVWLGHGGRPVLGFDYVGIGVERAQALARRSGVSADVERLTLSNLRAMVVTAAQFVAKHPVRPALYAHRLLDSVSRPERENLWQMGRVTRGRAFLEFAVAVASDGSRQPPPPRYLRTLEPREVEREIESRGGRVVQVENATDDDVDVCRLVARWDL